MQSFINTNKRRVVGKLERPSGVNVATGGKFDIYQNIRERVQPCHLISATTAIFGCQLYRNILAVAVDARAELWVMEFGVLAAAACFPSPSSMRSYAAFEACRSPANK